MQKIPHAEVRETEKSCPLSAVIYVLVGTKLKICRDKWAVNEQIRKNQILINTMQDIKKGNAIESN